MHSEIKTYQLLDSANNPAEFILKGMAGIFEQANGEVDRPHRHDYYTVILIEKAKGKHFIDFKEYPLSDHCLFFIYPGQVHQVVAEGKPEGWVINFTGNFLMKNSISDQMINDVYLFNKHGETPPLPVKEEDFKNYLDIIRQIKQYSELEQEYRTEALGALLKLILIQSNRHCSLHKPGVTANGDTGNQLLRGFKQKIDLHFMEYHKVADYAKLLAVSSDYLNKTVKNLTGKSAKEYILNRIIVEAKRALLFTELTNKELAFSLGFEEPSHFSAFFKKYNGVSPLDFRQSARLS